MIVHRIIASVFGIGYIGPGAGSVAAACVVLVWIGTGLHALPLPILLGGVVVLTVLGIWSAGRVEREWGTDSARVVVDEAAGMGIALIGLPGGWATALGAFVLFRALDIAKPLGISRMEKLPGGWGVMGDDVLAGLVANLILQAVVRYGRWPAA